MARDRNLYVWQAYVVVMSFVSLLSIGALCYVIFQSGTNYKTVEAAQAQAKAAEDNLRKELDKSATLSMILAFACGHAMEWVNWLVMVLSLGCGLPGLGLLRANIFLYRFVSVFNP